MKLNRISKISEIDCIDSMFFNILVISKINILVISNTSKIISSQPLVNLITLHQFIISESLIFILNRSEDQ